MVKLTYETYGIIKERIEGIIDMEWATQPESKLALLGGIIINID